MTAKVFDLDAVVEEAAGGPGPFTFRFAGQDFELPGVLDVRAAALVADGNPFGALRVMLGEEAFGRLCDAPGMLTQSKCWALIGAYGEHLRSSVGESSASTASSPSTAKRSRQTSKPTTKSA